MVGRLTPSSRAPSAIRPLPPLRSMHRRAASRIRCVASASSAGGRPAQLGAIFVALWPDTREDLTLYAPCKVLWSPPGIHHQGMKDMSRSTAAAASSGTSTGPLAGVKVLDLSIALTGPYAVALLADQGAEVVKVERPGIGDIARWIGVSVNGMSAFYLACNRGKRCIAVDLATDEGQDIVMTLAATADVIVQNFRPGVIARLALGYEAVRALNPEVIYCSVSGYGPEGPYSHRSAYDTSIQAYAGFAANQADPNDGPPTFLHQNAADKVSALYACQAITGALYARATGRGGPTLDVGMA